MTPFLSFVDQISDTDLTLIFDGKLGISCDDNSYRLSEKGVRPIPSTQAGLLREQLKAQERALLGELYKSLPLCRAEFDYQARRLLESNGAHLFCQHPAKPNNWALMIEDGALIAVEPEDVRSQYGYFYESTDTLSENDALSAVEKWLGSGQAYEDYRVKTHCTYICR